MPKDDRSLPDPEAAWSAIRRECVRRGSLAERRPNIQRAVDTFAVSLRGAAHAHAERVRQALLAIIAVELAADPKPVVRDAFRLARDLINIAR